MARYDYRCTSCGTTFEVEHPMGEHPEVVCPECGAKAEKVFEPGGIQFKGSGFYNTDQRSSHATPATTESSSGSGSGSKCANCSGGGCEKCA